MSRTIGQQQVIDIISVIPEKEKLKESPKYKSCGLDPVEKKDRCLHDEDKADYDLKPHRPRRIIKGEKDIEV